MFILGVVMLLDRGFLAIGNVIFSLYKSIMIVLVDFIFNGHCSTNRNKKYTRILHKEEQNIWKHILFLRVHNDNNWMVFVYLSRICFINIWHIYAFPFFHHYNICLLLNTPHYWTISQNISHNT